MSKMLNVDLSITADVSQAKQNLENLKASLNSISTMQPSYGKKLTGDLKIAADSAKSLQFHLSQAMNAKTGNLNLSAFEASLKSSGQSVGVLSKNLLKAGIDGEKAFMGVQNAIMRSNVQINQGNGLMGQFLTTLKNTARWQISSMVLHGFLSSIRSAYTYAQDLNKSLTNIRIITGYSTDEMRDFASQANKAAKALSSTTVAYTDAALIYYQQGLTGDAVTERAEATLKMANVTGQSAKIVSDQMTAVWNNFDDGTKSLEYYADVMTALGATTASSTDEIAQGLEKFAAVAETVGLSYEYATAALATVTATTRQSADVVGTAFKTLFARIQDLELGETLDDGTTLGTYSEALEKVGINIKESNGSLKEMDAILNEMGEKWKTIDKDQQVALAQSVAGVRQYTQLIALMNNWDYMKQNVATAQGSEGTLTEQQERYAESWEAASKKAKASLETLYSSLLDDRFFIKLTNGFAKLIDGISFFTNSLGGMQGVLLLISNIILTRMQPAIAQGFNSGIDSLIRFKDTAINSLSVFKDNFVNTFIKFGSSITSASQPIANMKDSLNQISGNNLKTLSSQVEYAENNFSKIHTHAQKITHEMLKEIANSQSLTNEFKSHQKTLAQVNNIQSIINQNSKYLTAQEKETLSNLQQQALAAADAKYVEEEKLNILKEQRALRLDTATSTGVNTGAVYNQKQYAVTATSSQFTGENVKMIQTGWQEIIETVKLYGATVTSNNNEIKISANSTQDLAALEKDVIRIYENRLTLLNKISAAKQSNKNISKTEATELSKQIGILQKEGVLTEKIANRLQNWVAALKSSSGNSKEQKNILDQLLRTLNNITNQAKGMVLTFEDGKVQIADTENHILNMSEQEKKVNIEAQKTKNIFDQINRVLTSAAGRGVSIGGVFSGMLSGVSSVAMAINQVTTAVQTLGDENASFAQKMVSTTMAATMAFSAFSTVVKGAGIVLSAYNGYQAIKSALDAKDISLETFKTMIKEKGIQQAYAEIVAKEGVTAANTQVAISEYAMLGPLLLYVAIAALAIAAIAGIIALVDALTVSEKEALQAAEEREQRAADAANRVKEEIDGINSSLDNIKSKTEAFEDLEKGTMEWYQALSVVNAEVQSLIDKYPELLAMGAIIRNENGLLGITDEGIEYVNQANMKKQTITNNISLRAQQNTNQVRMNNNWDNFKYTKQESSWEEGNAPALEAGFKSMVAAYQVYGDAMFESVEYAEQVRKIAEDANNGFDIFSMGGQPIARTNEELLNLLKKNKDLIIEQNGYLEKINQIEDQILMNRMALLGSKRNVEQAKELMGDYDDDSVRNGKKSVKYTDENGIEREHKLRKSENKKGNYTKEMEDFMSLYGEDVEFVKANRNKVVLKIDGQKVKIPADEYYAALEEMYDERMFEEALKESLQEDLNKSFSGLSLGEDVSTENLIALDNFRLGIENSLKKAFPDATAEELKEKVATTFSKVVEVYGTSEEALKSFAANTEYIDIASGKFQNLTAAFEEGKISVDQYKQSIQELNAEGELSSMSSWFIEQAEAMGLEEEDAGKMQEYARNLMEASTESDNLANSLKSDAKSAADLAVEITRMNKGIDSLADGFEDWSDVIKKSSKASAEYSDAMFEMKSALADVLDVESDLISSDFVEEHLDEIEKAAEGDAEAIDALRADMDEEIILNITSGQTDEFIAEIETLDNKIQDLAQNLPDIEVGAILNDADFLAAANNLVEQSGMTADEANAYFAGIGYEPVYSVEDVDTSMDSPNVETVTHTTGLGFDNSKTMTADLGILGSYQIPAPYMTTETVSTPLPPSNGEEKTRLMSFSGDGTPPKIKGLRKKATGSQNNYSSLNSGGKSPGSGSKSSNSKSNKKQKTKKSEVVERYKEITDQLDDVTRATDKASKAADRLYGPARLKAMKDVSKSLKDELGLLEQKSKEVAKNYTEDQFYLNSVSKSAGLNFEYDEAGNITNYSGEMTKLYEQLRQAEASGDEDAIDLAEEKIDTITSAIEQYDETRELWEDVADEMDEKFYEWQDNNAAIFEYELEIKIDATEFENKFLEFEKDWFADDAYSFAESVAATGQLLQNSEQNLQSYSQSFNELQQLFAEGKISQAAFMEQLQNLSDGALEEFGNIIEYDKEMMEAYGTQLELNSEELAKYTDRLDHLNSVLEHYNNLLDLTGQSQNYDAKGKVLATQEKNAANIYEVNKAYFDDKQAEADALKAQLDAALASGNEGAAELYQKQWEDADAAAREAQENMLSSAESWAEVIKATLENKLAGLADTLADALTGGKGFDQLNTELERLEATQEEFLTTTNKIYETNKLINTAQKEIDKTNNTVAKQKLKAFQQETSQLQNQGELSQFELDIQQKKYDLLLAEIALEEAQNAKSVVRLQRDSEGNFGYVYTADEQKTADAEQSVADAENALYNTQLEGANKYAAQRQELIQAMYDEMTALTEAYHNGEIQSEAEYEALMQETQAYYYDRLADNSRLYKVATSEDSRIVQEAWSSNLSIMSIDGQEFEKAVDQYMIDTKEHLQEFENKMDNLAEQVGIDAESLDDSLGKVEKASEDLKNEVVDKLLPAQQQNLDKIKLLTDAYAINRTNTDLLKTAYGQLATAMGTAYTNASNLETQLRNTNQAAQLIGGTGWVQWDYSTGSGNENSGDLGRGKNNDDNLTTTPRSTAKTYKKADYARQGNKTYVKLNNGYWFSENDLIYQGNDVYSIKSGSYGGNLGLYGLEKIKQFDTGGYTGEWGSSEGKLAFVHEKELILNKEDTKNFLEAIKLLKSQYRDGEITIEEFGYLSKELESAIQNSVNAQRAMLASCLEYAGKQSKSTLSFNNKLNDALEQHVTIEAVFPNVEDRYEIEEAFMNLTNEASQYINRKNN